VDGSTGGENENNMCLFWYLSGSDADVGFRLVQATPSLQLLEPLRGIEMCRLVGVVCGVYERGIRQRRAMTKRRGGRERNGVGRLLSLSMWM
jgi:hypothetical protein